jgi:hypothetical protein
MAHVYIRVTKDKYRLPVAIADSARELAEITGYHPGAIYAAIYRKRGYFEKVDIGDLEEDE